MLSSSHDHAAPNWLKAKLSNWFWSLTPACKDVARLTSESHEKRHPLGLRLRLTLHRTFCKWCARYARQLELVNEATHLFPENLEHIPGPNLNTDKAARMKRALRDAAERTILIFGGWIAGAVG